MVMIRIADHVEHASTYRDGQVIFDLIIAPLCRRERVEVSFDGIVAVPSAFVNAALVQLLEHMSMDVIRSNLVIKDSTRYINELIRQRFQFVTSQPSPGPMRLPVTAA